MTDYSNIVKELVAFHGRKALAKVRQYGSKPLQVLKQAPIAATAVLGASSTGSPLVIAAGLGVTAYAAQKIKAQGIVSYPKTPRELLDELEAMKRSDFLRSPTRSTLTDVEGYINFVRKQLRSFNNCLDLRAIPKDNFQNVSNILNSAPIPSCLKKIIFKPDSPEQVTRLIDILKSKKNLPEDFKLVIIGSPETYSLEESFVEVKNETPDSSLVDAAKTAIKEDPVSYAFQETGKEAIRLYEEHLDNHVERLKDGAVEIGGKLKGTAESVYEDLKPRASYGYRYARTQGRRAFRQATEKVKTHVEAGYTGAKHKWNNFTAYMDNVFTGMKTRFSSSPEDSSTDEASSPEATSSTPPDDASSTPPDDPSSTSPDDASSTPPDDASSTPPDTADSASFTDPIEDKEEKDFALTKIEYLNQLDTILERSNTPRQISSFITILRELLHSFSDLDSFKAALETNLDSSLVIKEKKIRKNIQLFLHPDKYTDKNIHKLASCILAIVNDWFDKNPLKDSDS